MIDDLSVNGKAGGSVGHQALALSAADLGAQVGLGGLAEDARGFSEKWQVAQGRFSLSSTDCHKNWMYPSHLHSGV